MRDPLGKMGNNHAKQADGCFIYQRMAIRLQIQPLLHFAAERGFHRIAQVKELAIGLSVHRPGSLVLDIYVCLEHFPIKLI
jgi:hypothetical protein